MAKTVSTFSDGSTDAYNGNRPIKAAWAVFNRETGERILSGHSLDRQRAEKTSRSQLQLIGHCVLADDHFLRDWRYISKYMTTFAERKRDRDHNENRLEEITRRVRVEVVDV